MFSYAYFTCLSAFVCDYWPFGCPIWRGHPVLALDPPIQGCLTYFIDHPCGGHFLVLSPKIPLLNSTLTPQRALWWLWQGYDTWAPSTESFISSSAPNPLSFLSAQAHFMIWPIIFILTIPVDIQATDSCISKTVHNLFPVPTPHPSLPLIHITSSGLDVSCVLLQCISFITSCSNDWYHCLNPWTRHLSFLPTQHSSFSPHFLFSTLVFPGDH